MKNLLSTGLLVGGAILAFVVLVRGCAWIWESAPEGPLKTVLRVVDIVLLGLLAIVLVSVVVDKVRGNGDEEEES